MRDEGAGLWESVFSANCDISVSYPEILLRPAGWAGVDTDSYPEILLRPAGWAGVDTD